MSEETVFFYGIFALFGFCLNEAAPLAYSGVKNNSIAAATENEDYSKNYNPGAVIVKEMAEAVVVHICSSKVSFERWLISILCRTFFLVIGGREIFKKEVFEP